MEPGEPQNARPLLRADGVPDPEAFAASIRPRMDAMLRTATAILGDEHEALDALQEALVDAWRGLPGLRDPSRYDAWLARILLNRCRMALRRARPRRLRQISVIDPADHVTSGRDMGDVLGDRDALDRAFDRLRSDERSVLVLHYLEGQSVEQMALVLEVPEGTVKSRLFNARRALANALGKEWT